MINLKYSISTIEKLLAENSDASLTYAALECRLAIEGICYERLRVAHDYISHKDLGRWQPKHIVTTLIEEVDPRIASPFTLSISKEPIPQGISPSLEDFQAMEYVPVGAQAGFKANKLGSLWQGLSNAALHVRMPENKDDTVPHYGDPKKIRAKVLEALEEIKRIATGTLVASGLGKEISFECPCGMTNKRKFELLRDRHTISCVNPDCVESYRYDESTASFQRRTSEIVCKRCHSTDALPTNVLERLRTDQNIHFECQGCHHEIFIQWQLSQCTRPKPEH